MEIEKVYKNIKDNAMNNFHEFIHGERKAITNGGDTMRIDRSLVVYDPVFAIYSVQSYILRLLLFGGLL